MSKKQNDAAIMSSLGGIFQSVNKDKVAPPSPAPVPTVTATDPVPAAMPSKTRGGKRSDKEHFSQFTVYLKKDTPRLARRQLEDDGSHWDFSDLVQDLVDRWFESRT